MKQALVTGVSGGMGFMTAKKLIREGYQVFGLDIREPEEMPSGLFYVSTDLTDPASVEAAFQKVKSQTSCLDCLIHLAGIYELNSLVEMSEEAFTRIFQVNLFAAFYVNKTFLPLLKAGSRVLVTTSELAPLDPLPFTGIYGFSKTALEKYAFSLRKELQLLGIRVIVLRPGAVDTGLLDVSQKKVAAFAENTKLYPHNAKRFQTIVDRVESRRISPEQLAELAFRAVEDPHPRFVYTINRNPLLILMHLLPARFQDWILKKILQP